MEGKGKFELICGPMFSGKTEELIRRLKRLDFAKKKYLIFKPMIDDKYALDDVASHDGNKKKSIVIDAAKEIIKHIKKNKDIKIIAIDEIQFFDDYIIKIVETLADKGYRIIATGLDKDFKGEPFGPMGELICLADEVIKLKSVCNKCGEPASFTQRIIDDRPAAYTDEIVMVGSTENYEARCRKHHEVLGKPKINID